MDVWEILVSNSSLTTGDAWEHLNAQEGGGSMTIFADDLQLQIDDEVFEIQIEDVSLTLELNDQGIILEIADENYILEVHLDD